MADVVSLDERCAAVTEAWKPEDLVTVNGSILRLGRFEGEFVWHSHHEDEMFLCWSGTFRIELEGSQSVDLSRGDLFVVPAGQQHRPVADNGPAYAIMVERPETQQYGND